MRVKEGCEDKRDSAVMKHLAWCTQGGKGTHRQGVTERIASVPSPSLSSVNQEAESSAGGRCWRFGIDAEKRGRWSRADWAADSGYHGFVGTKHPWCGISSIRAEETGAGANPWLKLGRMSRAEGQGGKAVEGTGKRMAVMMPCAVWRSGAGEPGGAGPRGKVRGVEMRMRSAGGCGGMEA